MYVYLSNISNITELLLVFHSEIYLQRYYLWENVLFQMFLTATVNVKKMPQNIFLGRQKFSTAVHNLDTAVSPQG